MPSIVQEKQSHAITNPSTHSPIRTTRPHNESLPMKKDALLSVASLFDKSSASMKRTAIRQPISSSTHIDRFDSSSMFSLPSDIFSISSMSLKSDNGNSRTVQICHPIPAALSDSLELDTERPTSSTKMYIPGIGIVNKDGNYLVEKRSLHELITKIEDNARHHLSSPAFVPSLDQIVHNPKNLTWRDSNESNVPIKHYKTKYHKKHARLLRPIRPSQYRSHQNLPTHTKPVSHYKDTDEESLTAPHIHHNLPGNFIKQSSDYSLTSNASSVTLTSTTNIIHGQQKSEANGGSNIPSVDLLGCHHPVELILYKANQRARKITELREQHLDKECRYREQVNKSIVDRLNRLEIKRIQQIRDDRALAWMRIIYLVKHAKHLSTHPTYIAMAQQIRNIKKYSSSAEIISEAVKNWYKRRVSQRMATLRDMRRKPGFLRAIVFLKLILRIFRKRKAVKRVKYFLDVIVGRNKVSNKIHAFLYAARRIQRMIRTYLTCKQMKIQALVLVWDKLEQSFVKRVLRRQELAAKASKPPKISALYGAPSTQPSYRVNQRPHRVQPLGSDNESISSSTSHQFDYKLKASIESQDKRWHAINCKMDSTVQMNRLIGNIRYKTKAEVVAEYLLPVDMKMAMICAMLSGMRKEYIVYRQSVYRKRIERKKADFTEQDAFQLLQGDDLLLKLMIEEKVDASRIRTSKFQYEPFFVFSKINHNKLLSRIQAAHIRIGSHIGKLHLHQKNYGMSGHPGPRGLIGSREKPGTARDTLGGISSDALSQASDHDPTAYASISAYVDDGFN